VEKIDRKELFSLLGRGVATIPDADAPNPDSPPAPDWEDAIDCEPAAREIFNQTSLPRAARSAEPVSAVPLPEQSPAKAPAPPPVILGTSLRADQAKLQRLLEKSVPRLWHYALEKSGSADPGVQRQKLRELLVWLFEKEGYVVLSNAAAPYRFKNKEVKGRIDLVIQRKDGAPLLALETDWAKEPASILKLSGWSKQKTPVAWIVGASCEPATLLTWRRFADEVSASRSSRWLPILHLNHGWIND
jgi:hypothetical protein